MKESFTEADAEPAGKVFRHGGAAAYWKHYRETQEFEFELRGEGSELVIGVEAAASRARLKPNTFKQRMAQGHGVLNMVLQEDGREKCVTITRLGR